MSPLCSWTAVLFAALAARAAATPRRVERSQGLRLRPAADAGLLQAEDSAEHEKKPAFNPMWFAEDQRRLEQMPPYQPDKRIDHMPGNPVCNPRCGYTCGHNECDQTCEPICLPPQCETLCMKSEDKCETRCNKPKCAVICPASAEPCPNGDCPKCRTICAPPACTTSCSGSCHSVCTQPQCTWKCKMESCPKPECKMTCSGFNECHDKFPNSNLTKVPIMPGMKIMEEARASMDPTSLMGPNKAPPPAGPEVLPQKMKESSIGHSEVPVAKKAPGLVDRLKMKWQAEDLVEENERLLRR